MYIVKKQKRITEELCIQDASGKEELKILVDLDVDGMIENYNRARQGLSENRRALEENPESEDAAIALGAATVHLFEIIFGGENTEKILACYQNRYTEMLEDIAPFILEVIEPQLNAAAKARADKYRKVMERRKAAEPQK